MDCAAIAFEIRPALRGLRMNRVLAVWADGSVTEEKFSFVDKPDGAGGRVRPIATFVGGLELSHSEIVERLERGLERGYGQAAG